MLISIHIKPLIFEQNWKWQKEEEVNSQQQSSAVDRVDNDWWGNKYFL